MSMSSEVLTEMLLNNPPDVAYGAFRCVLPARDPDVPRNNEIRNIVLTDSYSTRHFFNLVMRNGHDRAHRTNQFRLSREGGMIVDGSPDACIAITSRISALASCHDGSENHLIILIRLQGDARWR